MRRIQLCVTLLAVWLLAAGQSPPLAAAALAQDGPRPAITAATATPTAFVFQGKLSATAGTVNGACDFSFTLFDALQGGSRVGNAIPHPALAVVDGVFQAVLDYGATAFQAPRWLEISVRCPAGIGSFTVLSPRQPLQAVPYAVSALNAPDGFTVFGTIWVNGVGIFGQPGDVTSLSLRAPDIIIRSDPAFGRGDGGRAIVHDENDVLHINMENDFGGGVMIEGDVIISGTTTARNNLLVNGNDIHLNGEANRGDGGRALTHFVGDTLYVNYGNDFSGGTVLDSDVRVIKDFTVEGNTIRLLGSDLFIQDTARGDGGRALVHTASDTLNVNYEGDFAGGVRITGLRTSGIVEENLMTAGQQRQATVPGFEQGDVLCWDAAGQQLAKCAAAVSPLVVAVADGAGRPLVLGVEPIKVAGAVSPGDLLVSSPQAGVAQAWDRTAGDPPAGTIVGKALEASAGPPATIMALIQLQ